MDVSVPIVVLLTRVTSWLSAYFNSSRLSCTSPRCWQHRLVVRCVAVLRNISEILQWALKQKGAACRGDIQCSLAFCMHHTISFSHSPNLVNSDHRNRGGLFLPPSQISISFKRNGSGIVWNSPGTCFVVVVVLILMTLLLSSCCSQVVQYNCDLKGCLLREESWDAKHTFDNKKL